MGHAATGRAGEPPLAEGSRRTVKERTETCLRLRADDGIGTREHAAIKQIPGPSPEGDACKHRVWRPDGREKRGASDIAIGRIMNPAEVVGHGVGDGVAHAHRAGVMVGGSEIIPARPERSERPQSLGRGTSGYWNHTARTGQYFEWLTTGKDKGDLIRNSVHRIPGVPVNIGFGAPRKILNRGFRVAERYDRFGPVKVFFGRG